QPTSSVKQPVEIDEPLLEALEVIRSPLQANGARVHMELPDESQVVLGQPGQIMQVFLDLLQNAMAAMYQTQEPHVTMSVAQRDRWARVGIADAGGGIRPEYLTRVFEPGFTTKVDQGISRGVGLGLYAAHTIVQAHRGWIDVTSNIRKGSTFTVYLPTVP